MSAVLYNGLFANLTWSLWEDRMCAWEFGVCCVFGACSDGYSGVIHFRRYEYMGYPSSRDCKLCATLPSGRWNKAVPLSPG